MLQQTQGNSNPRRILIKALVWTLISMICIGALVYELTHSVIAISIAVVVLLLVIYFASSKNRDETISAAYTNKATQTNYFGTQISEELYNQLSPSVHSFWEFLYSLIFSTDGFYNWLKTQHLPMEDESDLYRKVRIMIMADIQTGFIAMGCPKDMKSKEGFAKLMIVHFLDTDEIIEYKDLRKISKEMIDSAQDWATTAFNIFNKEKEEDKLCLSNILQSFNKDIQLQYLIVLYRFFSIAAKADGVVSEKESAYLKNILTHAQQLDSNVDVTKELAFTFDATHQLAEEYSPDVIMIGQYIVQEQKCDRADIQRHFAIGYNKALSVLDILEDKHVIEKTEDGSYKVLVMSVPGLNRVLRGFPTTETKGDKPSTKNHHNRTDATPNEPAINQLDKLIGLASVKKDVQMLANFVKIQKKREEQGLKTSALSYHCVFTGNPGTGKTTVARIVAEIYRDLGVITKGHLIETDRSGLVSEYLGDTARKTNELIDSALDGVLFIDEAYALAQGGGWDYGDEAIATLLKRMEDNRDRLVVIIAGYTKEMKDFIDSNPGLQSRFNRYIEFPDYSADELMQIFEMNMRKYDYHFGEGAKEQLQQILDDAIAHKDKNFGNGRFVRNIFEKVLQHQADRLASESNLTTEQLSSIEKEDLTDIK